MARLRHDNGSVVNVPDEKVEALLSRGFTAESEKKAPAKKAAPKSTSK